jgi:hypothetical protein
MLKCAEEEQFDTKTSKCIFVCKEEGLFPVVGDDGKYRECVNVGRNKFVLNEREFRIGSAFDTVKGRCIVVIRSVIV